MTAKKIFQDIRIKTKNILNRDFKEKNTNDNYIIYISCSPYLKKEVKKLFNTYKEDLLFDIDLGIIKEVNEAKIYLNILEKSVNNIEVY